MLENMLPHWILIGMAAAFIGSFTPFINHHFKQDGLQLAWASSLLLAVFWLPFTFVLDWPENPIFYCAVAGCAVAYSVADVYFFKTTSQYGAGVTSRLKSLILPLVFLTWLPVSLWVTGPELLANYANNGWHTAGIVAVVGAMFYVCFWLARHDEISRAAFLLFLPGIIAATMGNILNKTAMESAAITSAVILYNCFVYGVKAVLLSGVLGYKRKRLGRHVWEGVAQRQLWLAALCFMSIAIFFNPLKNITMSQTPHPAYASVIFQTTPFMIALVYKAFGLKDAANVKIGLLMSGLGILFILLVK